MHNAKGKAGGERKAEKSMKFSEDLFLPQYSGGTNIYLVNLTVLMGVQINQALR